MRKILAISLISFTIAMLSFSSAHARHLGPVVLGQERSEVVIFCPSLAHALLIAREDERSTKVAEYPDEFFSRTEPLADEGNCDAGRITYTPLQTIHQWTGGIMLRGPKTQMSLIASRSNNAIIYVFTSDQAPTPVDKPKL